MRAVILWGGRLVEGPGRRSNIEKWRESLWWTAVWDRVASVLVLSGRFDEIVYCGNSDSHLPGVRYVPSSSAKHFFKTLDYGLEWVDDDETVAVFASDLPLISVTSLESFPSSQDSNPGLGLFYTTNSEIQSRYPLYNPDKRYASFEEGDIVFSNVFTVRKSTWKRISILMDHIAPGWKLNPLWLAPMFLRISPVLLLRAFVHSNSKLSDSSPFVGGLKNTVSKPSLMRDVLPAISEVVGDGISVSPAEPELSVDYDRRSCQTFFESTLSLRST